MLVANAGGRLRYQCCWKNITKTIFAPGTRCWLVTLEEGCGTSAPLISSPGTSLQPSPTGKNRNGGKQKYHPVTTDCQRISFYSLCHLPPHITATQRNFAEIARSPPKPSAHSSVSTNQSMSHLKSISKCHQTLPLLARMMMMMDVITMMMMMMTRTRSKFVPLELCHRYVIASFQPWRRATPFLRQWQFQKICLNFYCTAVRALVWNSGTLLCKIDFNRNLSF